jgi:RNA polymerase sigma-70 factor (ECF subfamily)
MALSDFDDHAEDMLRHALAGLLQIPAGSVRVVGKRAGSVILVLELPSNAAERLLESSEESYQHLNESLPFKIVSVCQARADPDMSGVGSRAADDDRHWSVERQADSFVLRPRGRTGARRGPLLRIVRKLVEEEPAPIVLDLRPATDRPGSGPGHQARLERDVASILAAHHRELAEAKERRASRIVGRSRLRQRPSVNRRAVPITARVLFRRYRTQLSEYFMRATGSYAAASLLTQQLFLQVMRTVTESRPPERPIEWIFMVARTLAVVHNRSQSTGQATPGVPMGATGNAAFGLSEALGLLSQGDREAFLLREVAGLSYQELAAACDTTQDNVRSRVCRARCRLRALLSRRSTEKDASETEPIQIERATALSAFFDGEAVDPGQLWKTLAQAVATEALKDFAKLRACVLGRADDLGPQLAKSMPQSLGKPKRA